MCAESLAGRPDHDSPLLILGAGINGAAIAREFLLNRVPVCLVDTADMASGTTAYSSRLIHGGLRYLEYGEFALVRESLAERSRLLRLAPQFVQPLRFHIPASGSWQGLATSVRRFFGWKVRPESRQPRGAALVRAGLWLYDWLARADGLPSSSRRRVADVEIPLVNRESFQVLCSYSDAQIRYPERFVVALLQDAARAAQQHGVRFEVYPYHSVRRADKEVIVSKDDVEVTRFPATAIVNATGVWVDETLQSLAISERRLMGGTKGSHLLTWNESLRAAIGDDAIYAEAEDGRPVFLLPWGGATLIGTTDIPFDGRPEDAVASEEEIDYLLRVTNRVVAGIELTRADVGMHYCGVRPLPYSDPNTPASSITRSHAIVRHEAADVPTFSIVGGKLTTCRSLAEETVAEVAAEWDASPEVNSRDRPLPGGEGFPVDRTERIQWQQEWSTRLGLAIETVAAVAELLGTSATSALADLPGGEPAITHTDFPREFVRRIIRDEWVTRVDDLVERRLMLLYDQKCSSETLEDLLDLLIESGRLERSQRENERVRYLNRLREHFGRVWASVDS